MLDGPDVGLALGPDVGRAVDDGVLDVLGEPPDPGPRIRVTSAHAPIPRPASTTMMTSPTSRQAAKPLVRGAGGGATCAAGIGRGAAWAGAARAGAHRHVL